MFYLLLRLLYEDWKENMLTEDSYELCLEKLADLHNNNKQGFWLACEKYFGKNGIGNTAVA